MAPFAAGRALLGAAFALAVATFLVAPTLAEAPRVYAIVGARIVTASGPTLEAGTVVVRGGSIEGVGATLPTPVDAFVIDGAGLSVYPGLIDLGSNALFVETPPPTPPPNATRAELERWKRTQLLRPHLLAGEAYKVDARALEAFAAAGITSVLLVPPGEGFVGQSALVDVVAPEEPPQIGALAETRRAALLRAPVGLQLTIPERPRGETYPESLMGMIAFIRQTFLDAQHQEVEVAHARRVKGALPAIDPALDSLTPALAGRLPVAIEANSTREILRALSLAKEFKLDPIVVGALEASETIAELKGQNARVIVSLRYPERPRSLAPDADEPLRVLRERATAPLVAAALAAAGVTFGFESAGLREPRRVLANAAKAVKLGLPAEAAVRAFTIDAARIAGVADRLGSIEKGKLANLVVTEGDLFAAEMTIRHVFVGGRPVDLPRVDAGGRPGRSPGSR